MVGRLRELVEDAHLASGDGCGREDRRAEELLRNGLRAGEGEEDAARADLRQRAGVEALVALHGVPEHLVVLGEGRRVEDDQVVAVADVAQVLHGVGRDLGVRGALAEVQSHVLRGQLHGALRRIDRADLAGPSGKRVDREAARVAERVEHGASLGVALHQFAVFALVEEEPGLLALFPIDEELLAVFQHHLRGVVRRAPQVAVHRPEVGLEGERLRRLVVDGRDAVAVDRADRLGDLLPAAVHTHRMTLDDGRRAVDVRHQPRQRVPLAVDQPVARRLRAVGQRERAAHVVGHGHAAVPPRLVNLFAFEGEDPDGDRADLVVSQGDELSRAVVDLDQGALGDLGLLLGLDVVDGTREDPRVAAQERLLLAPAQVNLRYHWRSGFFGVRSSRS